MRFCEVNKEADKEKKTKLSLQKNDETFYK